MELKSGYKQTEAGVIPEDWEVKALKEISPRQSVGLVINPSTYFDPNESIPMLVGSSVTENRIDAEAANRISAASNFKLVASRLTQGDLVTVRVGDPGVTAVVPPELDQCNCASMMIVRQDRSFNSHWLCSTMNSRHGRQQVENVQYGTAQKQFNIKDAVNFIYAVPPLQEQNQIATVLSEVELLLMNLEQVITKKRNIKQAAMQELLTGKRRLPGFMEEWKVKKLGDVLRFQVGCPFSSAFFNDKEQGVRLIKNRDLKSDDQVFHYSGKYDPSFQVSDGDVLVGMDGDFVPCQWGKGPALLNQRVGRIVPLAGLSRSFAFYYLIGPLKEIESATSGTTVKHLSHGDIEGIEKPLPSISEQHAIAAVLREIDTEVALLQQRREKTCTIQQGMMQQLLTGKIRLR